MLHDWRLRLLSILLAGCLFTLAGCGDGPPAGQYVRDLDGQSVDPLESATATATVFLFSRTDCPISNRYAPYVRRLDAAYTPKGVSFYLIYCDPDESAEVIAGHLQEYNHRTPALMDPNHVLVNKTGARVTPEAVVFDRDDEMVYRGRIDDQYVDFGKTRAAPTKKDLEEVLDALVAGESVSFRTTEAIGCFIQNL